MPELIGHSYIQLYHYLTMINICQYLLVYLKIEKLF